MSNKTHVNVYNTLIAPHMSEKASIVQANGCYVFKIAVDAKKDDVKKAVEQLFEVKVDSVRTVNVKGKTKRFAQRAGKRKNWKKAYVALKEGQIDLMTGE